MELEQFVVYSSVLPELLVGAMVHTRHFQSFSMFIVCLRLWGSMGVKPGYVLAFVEFA